MVANRAEALLSSSEKPVVESVVPLATEARGDTVGLNGERGGGAEGANAELWYIASCGKSLGRPVIEVDRVCLVPIGVGAGFPEEDPGTGGRFEGGEYRFL